MKPIVLQKTFVSLLAVMLMVTFANCSIQKEDALIAGSKSETSALASAAERGDNATVKSLLAEGGDVNTRGTDDFTVLMLASRHGHSEVAQTLLTNGADVQAKEKHYGQTALMIAAYKGHTRIVVALLDGGADVNASRRDGVTPLMFAAWSLQPDISLVKALLDKGADVNRKDSEGHTALDRAKNRGYNDIVELLKKYGAEE